MKSCAAGLALAVALTVLSAVHAQQKEPAADKKEAIKGEGKGMMGGG
jgi:hypothetical protein